MTVLPTIAVSASCGGLLFAGHQPMGVLLPETVLPLPLGREPITFFFLPTDGQSPASAYPLRLQDGAPFLVSGAGLLARRSHEFYELRIEPSVPRVPKPPILTCQTHWGNGWAGLCGDWFVWECENGVCQAHGQPITAFTVLSPAFTLLRDGEDAWIINAAGETVWPRATVKEASVAGSILTLRYTPGHLRFYEIIQRFDTGTMQCQATELRHASPASAFETAGCFCEAVRLGDETEAMAALTPGLQSLTDFAGIRDFLGPFDACEPVRFLPGRDGDVALRYVVDERNAHYRRFSFTFVTDGDQRLIDDITEEEAEENG